MKPDIGTIGRFVASLMALMIWGNFVHAGSVRTGFSYTALPANDDGSTGSVGVGFNLNFFGTTYSSVYVNNNGNVTFTGPLSTFTPFNLSTTATPIIAPFFADVDTRGAGSGLTEYGLGLVGGHNAFSALWNGVGYYGLHADKLNTFQLVLIDRSDRGAGDFDFELNYNQIQWDTGDVSGTASARAGYSNGTPANSFELPGSGVQGSFLDSNPISGLIYNSNVGVAGRYLFSVENGNAALVVVPTPTAMSASSAVLGMLGLVRLIRGRKTQPALLA